MAWIATQGMRIDRVVGHLDLDEVSAGDTVIGTLPVHLAASVCAKQASYLHLSIDLPSSERGVELDSARLAALGAKLQRFDIKLIEGTESCLDPCGISASQPAKIWPTSFRHCILRRLRS